MVRVTGCCCFSLKTGSLIIATLGWICTICKLFSFDGLAPVKDHGDHFNQLDDDDSDMASSSLGYRIASAVISLIVCILLVIGIHKKSANFFIPWLIVSCLEAVLLTIVTGVCFVLIFIAPHPGPIAFGISFAILLCASALTWYFWLVVYSHYQEVKSGVVNVIGGTGGNVYYSPTTNYPPAYDKDRTQMA